MTHDESMTVLAVLENEQRMTAESIGCGDNSCIFGVIRKSHGMATNGGCRCFEPLISWNEQEHRWNRAEVQRVRRDVSRLAAEVVKLRNALAAISLDEYESTSSASEKVHGHARVARKALYGEEKK